MDIRKLQRAIVDGLEDVKAQHIVVFNTEHLSPLFERVIIASGTSNRQTKALASSVRDMVKSRGMPVLRVEGEGNGEWIIVDCGAAVAHIMQPGIREYYHLEELWGDKPVRVKLGSELPLPKAEAARKPAGDSMARGAAAKTAAAGPTKTATPAAGRVAAKTASAKTAPAKTAPAKTDGRRAAPAKKTVSRTVGVKATPVPTKTAAKKAGDKKIPIKKIVAKKVVAKRGAVTKAAPARRPRSA